MSRAVDGYGLAVIFDSNMNPDKRELHMNESFQCMPTNEVMLMTQE